MSSPVTAYEALREVVSRRRSAPALQFREQKLSYEDLLGSVERAAAVLRARGIVRGQSVVTYAQNTPELLYVYFAAAKLGAVYVPVNPNMTTAEVKYICQHCEASLLLHDALVVDAAEQLAPASRRCPITAVNYVSPEIERTHRACADIRREDDCLICYTSGSTGTPKAVVLDQASQVDVCASFREFWGLSDSDVTLIGLPLGYLYGLTTAAVAGLLSGGHVVVLPKYRPKDVLEAMIATRTTVYHGVPTMFTMMLEYAEQNGLRFDLSAVRQMICAGAPLPDDVASRFATVFRKRLHNYYGATECSPIIGLWDADRTSPPPGSVGRPAPGASVRIVGPDHTDCQLGVEGELYARAASMIKRYLKDPETTAAAVEDGWFRTGDLGRVDERGYYYITGRIKDVIFRGGANIAPAEVEAALSSHPAIAGAAVVGVPDTIYGEVPVAFVIVRGSSQPRPEELIAHAAATLADFKVPHRYVFVNEFPLGKTAKVDKAALKARWRELQRD